MICQKSVALYIAGCMHFKWLALLNKTILDNCVSSAGTLQIEINFFCYARYFLVFQGVTPASK